MTSMSKMVMAPHHYPWPAGEWTTCVERWYCCNEALFVITVSSDQL